jgi:hypothetical protein
MASPLLGRRDQGVSSMLISGSQKGRRFKSPLNAAMNAAMIAAIAASSAVQFAYGDAATDAPATNVDAPPAIEGGQAAGSSQILAEAASDQAAEQKAGTVGVNYFGIFYGPGVSSPSSFQPDPNGQPDPNRPLLYKNFLGVGYRVTNEIAITPTAYWQWIPVRGGSYAIQDPYVKISHNALISNGGFNLYGDVRYHVPISDYSRSVDSKGGLQTVEVATYTPEASRWTFGMFGSARANFYGKQGAAAGNDVELYVGPNVSYQIAPTLAGVILYEYNLNHAYGDPNGALKDDGYDVQPGLNWDITPTVLFNPYVNIYPTSANLKSTSLGFLISWQPL